MQTIRTPQKRGKFLAELRRCGKFYVACKYAGISRTALHDWRHDEPELETEIQAAIQEAEAAELELFELEMKRRGLDGVKKPVYYKGIVVGHIQEYSDTLLMFRAKKLNKDYRDSSNESKVSVNVSINLQDTLQQALSRAEQARNGHGHTVS